MTDESTNTPQSPDDGQLPDLAEQVGKPGATDPEPAHTSEILYWGPGGDRGKRELVDAWAPGPGDATTWGLYYRAQFPPAQVTPWIRSRE
jgi:hypothetical protein